MRYGAALVATSADDTEPATADMPRSTVGSGSGVWVRDVGAGGDCSGALCPTDAGAATSGLDCTGSGGGREVVSPDDGGSVDAGGGTTDSVTGTADDGPGATLVGTAADGSTVVWGATNAGTSTRAGD
jgi:hypothetical protein